MNKIVFVYKGRYFVRDTETISYLSAIARRTGYDTALVYDEDVFGITDNVFYQPLLNRIFSSEQKTGNQILALKPELVVFLVNFSNVEWITKIIKEIHGSEIKTVVISPLGTNVSGADYLLIGEPESVFEKFVQLVKNKEYIPPVIEVKELADLDNLPLPDKSLFAPFVDFSHSYMVYTSKGCVGNCSYCEEMIYKANFGVGFYRRRRVENVIEELKMAKQKYNPQEIIFKDSVFATDKKWLNDFLQIYVSEINIPFKCFGKADMFDEEIARLLKKSGCYCVEFGFQTLNERIRKEVLFRKETRTDVGKALEICDRYRLFYDIDHMFGLPSESVCDHKEAVRFYAGRSYLNRIKCHNLVVYPLTPIRKFIDDESNYSPDFFAKVSGVKSMKFANKSFQKFFKVLPLFNTKLVNWILRWDLWKMFYFIPQAFVIFGQLLIALKNNDWRFKVYCQQYPKKILRAMRRV